MRPGHEAPENGYLGSPMRVRIVRHVCECWSPTPCGRSRFLGAKGPEEA